MKSFLGLSLEEAKKAAKAMNLRLEIIQTRAKKDLADADTEIVIRQRQKQDGLEIVVSAFKTKLR